MTSMLRFSLGLACVLVSSIGLSAAQTAAGAVTVSEDDAAFTLANGIVTARVSKRNGDLLSLQYRGVETLAFNSGHSGGYWSHDTTGGTQLLTKITLDPAKTGGERGEVSVKGISGGRKMGHGPGAAQGGDFPADIEIRYTLGRGDSGIYTSCTFDHLPGYPAATMTEARYCAKLADMFDWLTMDEIGYRATTAALSDLAAMGAGGGGVLIALATPPDSRENLDALGNGIARAASAAGVRIYGGDTTRAEMVEAFTWRLWSETQ